MLSSEVAQYVLFGSAYARESTHGRRRIAIGNGDGAVLQAPGVMIR
jgi:hypothetical protein